MLHKNEILFSLWNGIPRCLTLFSQIVFKIISFLMLKKVSFSEKIFKYLVTKVSPLYRRWMVGHQLCKCSRTLSSCNPFGRAVLC